MAKYGTVQQAEKVVWMGETRHAYRIIVRKPLGKHLLSKMDEIASVWGNYTGKAQRRGEHSKKMGFSRDTLLRIGWMELAQNHRTGDSEPPPYAVPVQ
jgi:hypothetical protein